jgi:uncharacterized membrane protein YdjX (TVP38/TMEM64 family)
MAAAGAMLEDERSEAAPGPGPGRGVRARKLALAAVLLGALAAFFLLGGPRWLSFETLRTYRGELMAFRDRHYALVLAGAIVTYVAATALSFPGGVLMSLTMGFLFGRWVGTAAVVVAASVGATGAFLAARYLFADAARRRMGPRLQALARGFHENAFSYMLFVRLVPVFPFWLMNLVPAFTPVGTRTFFFATALGILPGTFVFVNLGQRLGTITSTRDLASAETLLSLALLGVLALIPVAWKKLRPRTPSESSA